MQRLLDEYRRSLKMKEAEEVVDLLFYRPIAFVFVKTIYRLPITPNQVTLLSLIAGLIAAWNFSDGRQIALRWGAVWFFGANILDCADGQLARLQNSGTLLGRVIDGVIDYVISIAVFIGIGIGKTESTEWLLVLLAGLSSGLHAIVFDFYQNKYISTVRGERNFIEREMEKFIGEIIQMKKERRDGVKVFFLKRYLLYLWIQHSASRKQGKNHQNSQLYQEKNKTLIRLWSFLGPTTNRTLLICASLFGNVTSYLWIVSIAGNVWLGICSLLQKRIDSAIASDV